MMRLYRNPQRSYPGASHSALSLCWSGWIGDVYALHVGERRKPVYFPTVLAGDLLDVESVNDQRISDQRAMAAPRHRFGAHHGDAFALGRFHEHYQLLHECRRLHIVGVSTEGSVPPTRI